MSKPAQHSAALARKLEKEKKQSASLEEYYVAVQRVEDTHTFFLNLYAKIEKHTSCIERTETLALSLPGLLVLTFAQRLLARARMWCACFATSPLKSPAPTRARPWVRLPAFLYCHLVVRSLRPCRIVVAEDCRVFFSD
jgi:hypothetical protein